MQYPEHEAVARASGMFRPGSKLDLLLKSLRRGGILTI